MKLFKNIFGFTIIEIMMALGIMSGLLFIIVNAQKQATNAIGDLKRTNDVNELIQVLTSELSKVEVCKKNFAPPTNTSLTPGTPGVPKDKITDKIGNNLIKVGDTIGSTNDYISIDDIILSSSGTNSKIYVTVKYTPHTPKAGAPGSFFISLNVFNSKEFPTRVASCFSDLETALIAAVRASCGVDGSGNQVDSNGAQYTLPTVLEPYGTCTHPVELRDANNVAIAAVATADGFAVTCPAGQVFKEIINDKPADDPNPLLNKNNKRIIKCGKIETVDTCLGWNYMKGMNLNGSPSCTNILDDASLFGAGTGILGTPYQYVSVTCPAGTILQGITSFAAPVCVNPNSGRNCPSGEVSFGVSDGTTVYPPYNAGNLPARGKLLCKPYVNSGSCPLHQFINEIQSDGNVVCQFPTINTSQVNCAPPTVVEGINSDGSFNCVNF